MSRRLLIVGAGEYGLVAKEIADETKAFDFVAFVDDRGRGVSENMSVLGTTEQLGDLAEEFDCAVVAIGNARVRLHLLDRIRCETDFELVYSYYACPHYPLSTS